MHIVPEFCYIYPPADATPFSARTSCKKRYWRGRLKIPYTIGCWVKSLFIMSLKN
jgi:hypothetical protein